VGSSLHRELGFGARSRGRRPVERSASADRGPKPHRLRRLASGRHPCCRNPRRLGSRRGRVRHGLCGRQRPHYHRWRHQSRRRCRAASPGETRPAPHAQVSLPSVKGGNDELTEDERATAGGAVWGVGCVEELGEERGSHPLDPIVGRHHATLCTQQRDPRPPGPREGGQVVEHAGTADDEKSRTAVTPFIASKKQQPLPIQRLPLARRSRSPRSIRRCR